MIYLNVDDIIEINNAVCNAKILNFGLLDSAISQAQHYRFETVEEISSAYLFFLCKNHPFTDGNKRTAFIACMVFLKVNGLTFNASADNIFNFVNCVATNENNIEDIKKWIESGL